MKALFHCVSIDQYRIMRWLTDQGLTRDDISRVELLGESKIRLTNPAGQYMDVEIRDNEIRTDWG